MKNTNENKPSTTFFEERNTTATTASDRNMILEVKDVESSLEAIYFCLNNSLGSGSLSFEANE
jgi:hypothetical protein